jgi:surface antigen
MNKSSIKVVALMIGATMTGLVGCASNTQGQNTGLGVAGGAIAGGAIGAAVASGGTSIAVGAIAGGLIGGVIGYNMPSSDKVHMYHVMNNTPTHHHKHWKNKKTQTSYNLTPTSNKMAYNGNAVCRHYDLTSMHNGKKQEVQGIACRQADGSWTAVKS